MTHLFILISFLGAVIGWVVGASVIVRDPGLRINRVFLAFSFSVGFFCFFDMLTAIAVSPEMALIFGSLSLLFWFILVTLIVPFCLEFVNLKTTVSNYYILPLVCLGAGYIAYVDYIYHFIYEIPVMTSWGYVAGAGPHYWFLVVYSVSFVAAALGLLFSAVKKAKLLRTRKQADIIIAGIAVSLAIGLLDVVFPAFNIFLPSFTPLATIFYLMFFTAAIVVYGPLAPTPTALANDIVKTMPGLLLFIDSSNKVKMVNKTLLAMLNYSENEVIDRSGDFIISDKEVYRAYHQELDRVGLVSKKQIIINKKDGTPVPARMEAAVVKDRAGEKIGEILIFLDIQKEEDLVRTQKATIDELTQTKQRMLSILEDMTQARDEAKRKSVELAKAVEDLKIVDRLKTQFMSVISHELRTPLTPIKGFSSMLLSGQLGQLTDQQVKTIESIKREGDHLEQLIDNILDVGWLERGHKMDLKAEPLALNVMIKELLANMSPQFSERDMVVESVIPDDLNTLVADRSKIYRVLSNIIGNAVKFSPSGGKIKVLASNSDNGVELRIIDTGIGVEKQYLEKIFERFFQIDNSYSRTAGGVGLGLAISKMIIESHGGRIWAESDGLGWGTKIVIYLPVGG
ncbi:hypothetical protein A3K48_01350 [candidate division WOR-1 bacterium RIFOXYA12_FULL_52_29]|uniref:histidine kinase n=1 Tax=candidate division WOR-1 bacterium RIFOXYC12_FULL_54_18 TaxID=1802584 RepID=A0A1F4T526_UNCSA|nr:MAG: hypothetical protein A3K44_01350 [candidate division WOR-1 bacterium RIFOXYA2_FULL_51_19]OGC17233.1 MAG: hypothetical protein A3K48_01350 [candidate division WOR-1 bacterium RIFOXYA12_FULL_52_29]OGC26093.1 MAG: hypothetical protein A3K32_01345 [candidate division WOR-1 bacterium RIFOXYB2_FULL_45_9]OGC27650.1 MAG: hypothetical protein A3K49_01350 [candidate division WOR-1 bacterium RIFOXYC12_FULL_54_18]OGC29136.1 MAG: hypothetical protein A2346_00355 [candidate division WOR-1 bacterium R